MLHTQSTLKLIHKLPCTLHIKRLQAITYINGVFYGKDKNNTVYKISKKIEELIVNIGGNHQGLGQFFNTNMFTYPIKDTIYVLDNKGKVYKELKYRYGSGNTTISVSKDKKEIVYEYYNDLKEQIIEIRNKKEIVLSTSIYRLNSDMYPIQGITNDNDYVYILYGYGDKNKPKFILQLDRITRKIIKRIDLIFPFSVFDRGAEPESLNFINGELCVLFSVKKYPFIISNYIYKVKEY